MAMGFVFDSLEEAGKYLEYVLKGKNASRREMLDTLMVCRRYVPAEREYYPLASVASINEWLDSQGY